MKYLFLGSGVLLAALLIMGFTGLIEFHDRGRELLVKGNEYYDGGDYRQALEAYHEGLERRADDPLLNYNAGQAAYYAGDYSQSADLFGKAPERPNTYLQAGNASLALGDAAEDANQKLQQYGRALQTYKEGILAFPDNLELKYNYEYVKQKLEQQEQEQQQQEQQDGENGEGEEGGQQQEQEQQGDQEQQEDGQGGDGQENQDGSSQDSSAASDLSREELEQIMELLERQEEDSLKRNQEIREQDAGDAYDW